MSALMQKSLTYKTSRWSKMDNYAALVVLQVPGPTQNEVRHFVRVSLAGMPPAFCCVRKQHYFVIRRKLCDWLPHKVCIGHSSLRMLTRLLSDRIRPRVPGPKAGDCEINGGPGPRSAEPRPLRARGLSPAEGCLSPPLILCQDHRHMLLHPAGRSCTRSRVHCLSIH